MKEAIKKKKLLKRALTLSLCACMMVGMAISASAADARSITPRGRPENAVHFRNNQKSMNGASLYMNALANTPAQVGEGTKVTAYSYSNDNTQKFYTQSGALRNASNSSLRIIRDYDSSLGGHVAKLSQYNSHEGQFSLQPVNGGYSIIHSNGQVLKLGGLTYYDALSFDYIPANVSYWFFG